MFSKKTKWICASERFVSSQDAAAGSVDALCMLARRQMKLPKRIKRAFLTISADDQYALYINGRFVSRGPAACYPQEQYCERLDVAKYLKFGHNIFAVQVHYDGKDSPSRVSGDNRQGFIAELELDGNTLPVSNEHVRMLCPAGASYIRENDVTAEWIDLRSFPADWTQLKFDDSAWIKPKIKKNHGYNFVKQPVLPGEYVEFEVTSAGDGVYDLEDSYTGTLCVQAHGIDGSTLSFYREDDNTLLYKLTLNGSSTADFSLPRRLRRIKVVSEGGAEISHLTARVLRLGESENALSLKTVTPALVEMDNRWKSALLDDVYASFDAPDEKADEGVLALAKSYMSGETGHLAMLLKNISLSQASVKTLLTGRPASRCREDREASLKFACHALIFYEQTGESELVIELRETAYGVIRAFSTYARRDGLLESTDESGEKVCLSRLNALYIGALISYEKLCEALKPSAACIPRRR
ncbi:MAG: alpha-L-rhamnosidase N-terminal domain-containing protein [Clostridia bacterium]|nr:alpha-L-rhamnosidase N-terminal domain-containing protein [Clostridia bacterium]